MSPPLILCCTFNKIKKMLLISECVCVCVTVIRDELLVLVAEDEHVIFQSDEIQVLVKHLRHRQTHTHRQSTVTLINKFSCLLSHTV